MEIFILLIGVPIAIGLLAAFGLSALAVIGYLIAGAFALLVNFWYLALAILLIMVLPLLYLDGLLLWLLIPIAILALAIFLAPLSEEQKAEIQRAKEALKKT